MSAAVVEILDSPTLRANQWIESNLDELTSRGRASLPRWDARRREDALAEILVLAVAAAHRAAWRGRLRPPGGRGGGTGCDTGANHPVEA
jgi:hypothetical protein